MRQFRKSYVKLLINEAIKKVNPEGFPLEDEFDFQDLHIMIETDKDSIRKGVNEDGTPWETHMKYPYGYISNTKAADDEHVDCYVGDNRESTKVFIVHQVFPDTGKYDEDKVMLGFNTEDEAKQAYLDHYDDPKFFGSMTEMNMEEFKESLKKNKGKKLSEGKTLLNSLIKEYLKNPTNLIKESKSCSCGCNSCGGENFSPKINENFKGKLIMTENMSTHINNKISLHDTKLDKKSKSYSNLIAEAKYLYSRNILDLNKEDIKLILEDKIPGGLAQGKTLEDIARHHDPKGYYSIENTMPHLVAQLTKGTKIEKEHTNDTMTAMEIALDHLWEDPEYYSKLEKIEK